MPAPIQYSGEHIDLSPRFFQSSTVAASPAGATETTICTVTVTGDLSQAFGIVLEGWFSFTVGTSGVSATVKIRRTNTTGTTVATTGALTVTAGNLYAFGIQGIDTGATLPGQVYVLTLTVGSGAAASTVSAANLLAQVV